MIYIFGIRDQESQDPNTRSANKVVSDLVHFYYGVKEEEQDDRERAEVC